MAPVSGNSLGVLRAEIKPGVREIHLCKDDRGKTGLRLRAIDKVGLGLGGRGGASRREEGEPACLQPELPWLLPAPLGFPQHRPGAAAGTAREAPSTVRKEPGRLGAEAHPTNPEARLFLSRSQGATWAGPGLL